MWVAVVVGPLPAEDIYAVASKKAALAWAKKAAAVVGKNNKIVVVKKAVAA